MSYDNWLWSEADKYMTDCSDDLENCINCDKRNCEYHPEHEEFVKYGM